jgi:parvulin-like peptidyl-prolyl isomerase
MLPLVPMARDCRIAPNCQICVGFASGSDPKVFRLPDPIGMKGVSRSGGVPPPEGQRIGLGFGNPNQAGCRLIVLFILTAICALFLPLTAIAQDPPPDPAPEESTSTPADSSEPADESQPAEPAEGAQPPTQETESKETKPSTERLDPETMKPGKDTVVGDGDQMVMVNNFVQIHGNALIKYDDVVLYADHIWADFDENIMRASGNVRLIIAKEETFSDELIFNLETKKGIVRNGFTYSDPWYYRGTEIFRIEEDESYVRGGSLTTCSLKMPHYYFSASQIIVRVNKELIAKNIVLKIGGIPLFYFPVYRRDLRKDKVAKIIVKVGNDSYQGPYLSIILPLARRHRYDAALLFDQSSRRGQGYGFDAKYRVNDVKYQEIFIPIPRNADPTARAKLEEKARELADRLDGDFDEYKLRQLFLEYKITQADIDKARTEAEELHAQLQSADADFGQLARNQSDHQATRYQGGDMGFLVRGEQDSEGNLKLEPVLEEAVFGRDEETSSLQAGEVSEILRTDFAFHILKVERVLDVYGRREIQLRRIDIAIEPSDETRTHIRTLAEAIQLRAASGEPFDQLAAEHTEAEVSEVNEGQGMPLNEMPSQWQYSVRRLKQPGDVTTSVFTDRGVSIFQLTEKEPTPTFEELAQQFEIEWETLKPEFFPAEEPNPEGENEAESVEDEPEDAEVDDTTDEADTEVVEGETEEEAQYDENRVYRKRGYRGYWEDPSAISGQTRQLVSGETSRLINTRRGHHLVKVDKKRTYRGDLVLLSQDQYSFGRQDAFKTGQRWTMRWGHNQSIYTPWDNPQKGRRPLNVMGRVEWQARLFKEGLGTSESTIDSFGLLTWGSAFSALDLDDKDTEGNLKFSSKTIGDFLARLQVTHALDLTGEGNTTLQKLPELTMSFSRMRMDRLPLLKTLNSGLTKAAGAVETDLPLLSMVRVPTLENTSFDLDIAFGNFFRERYQDYQRDRVEENVFLQTMNLGFDIRKQSTLQVMRNRELRLDLNLDTNVIWHAKDQVGNRNIFRGVYGLRVDARNTLFRIYDISFIPGARRMRHQVDSWATFDYQPAVDRDDNLYPFGPSTYFFERRRLSYNFSTSIEIKTRRNKSAHRIFDFDTRIGVDLTEDDPELSSFNRRKRKFDLIESDFRIIPLTSRNMNITFRSTHDPNPDEVDGKRFKMVGFRSSLSYNRKTWNLSLGSSFSKLYTRADRRINASWRFFPQNRMIDFDVNIIYDWIEKQFYSQRVSMGRNLHGWNMSISWYRVGLKPKTTTAFGTGNVRQDFTFQISLRDEPAVSAGLGYDAYTNTWGFRTLPAGVPYNAFGAGNTLGRSYF